MTPDQFVAQVQKKLAPAYLFLGPEAFARERCRATLREAALPPEDREEGFVRHDLDETPLAVVLDDARSMSLFARQRVLYCSSAEAALPRVLDSDDKEGAAAQLAAYLAEPSPDVVLVFDAARFGFEGEDKPKSERVRKFYQPVSQVIEFVPFSVADARALAQDLARQQSLKIGPAELDLLVEGVGADAARIAVEIEKLSLHAGPQGGPVTAETIAAVVPNARSATIFQLVAALGRNDAVKALHILDTLVREGEYLPLALSFLETQFRLAYAAKEAGLTNAGQIQAHFSKLGVPMWRARAEQVAQTVGAFSKAQLQRGIQQTFRADKALRDTRPDDRVVLEEFVVSLNR